MKKLFVVLLSVFICLGFSACGTSNLNLCKQNLAEVRYNIFAGENDEFTATFMSGKREKPYVVNGICEKTTDFGLICVNFKNDYPLVASFELLVNQDEYSGNLEYNQYDQNFMYDIGTIVADDAEIQLTIKVGSKSMTTKLNCKNLDFDITWQTALNIAVNEMPNLDKYIQNGKLNGEVYVKIITDLEGEFGQYFWYVSIYDSKGNSNAIIINPQTGEVIAKK